VTWLSAIPTPTPTDIPMAIHTPRFPNKVPTARHMPSPAPIAMPTASRLSAFIRSDYFPLITAIVSRHCGSSLIGTTISMPVPAYRERRSRESERVRCVPGFMTHQFSRIISRRRRRRNIFIPAPRPVAWFIRSFGEGRVAVMCAIVASRVSVLASPAVSRTVRHMVRLRRADSARPRAGPADAAARNQHAHTCCA